MNSNIISISVDVKPLHISREMNVKNGRSAEQIVVVYVINSMVC